MGSWSVYCGISKIAITAGKQCVLLPLKINHDNEGYLTHLPATLPIFGEYDDYGGIENITKDDNTQLIEEHFQITIEEFCDYLLNGKNTYNRSEVVPIHDKANHLEELSSFMFMWIDRKVYDFMSTYLDEHAKGYIHFGNPEFMTELGFEFIGIDENNKSYDPKRFKYLWKHGNKQFLTDNWTMLNGIDNKASYIMYVNPRYGDKSNGLSTHITIPEHMSYIADKAGWQLWKYNKKHEKYKNLRILGMSQYTYDYAYEELLKLSGQNIEPKKYDTLLSKYQRDYETFADKIADLITVRHNLHPMSGTFEPYLLYLTPQCGEYEHHQVILDKFSEINQSYIENDMNDDDE
jgi:hypothetical protein